jgi:hypothetical protein
VARTRTNIFDSRARACPYILYRRAGAGTDVFDSRARTSTDVLYSGVEPLAYQITGTRADIFDRGVEPLAYQITGASTDVFDRGIESFSHQLARAFAYIRNSRAHAFDQLLDDLRVAVYGGENAVENGRDVVEAHLQEGLRLDALYNELDPAEEHVGSDRELHQVEHLGVERHLRPQVVELEVDLIDLDHGYVEQHVGDLAVHHGVFVVVLQRVVRVGLLRHRPVAGYVVREPVLLALLDRGTGVVLAYGEVLFYLL